MRRLSLLLACLASVLSARADLTIVTDVQSAGKTAEMVTKFKGNKARIDVSEDISTIVDGDTGDMITLMHTQKKFVRIPGESTRALLESALKAGGPAGDENAKPPKPVATGEKEKISGYDTEKYHLEHGAMKVDYWLAPGFPNYAAILEQMAGFQKSGLGLMARELAAAPEDFPGFPMRTSAVINGQTIVSTVKTVRFDALSEKEFTPPEDYQALTVPLGE